jgi:hypothetical protein
MLIVSGTGNKLAQSKYEARLITAPGIKVKSCSDILTFFSDVYHHYVPSKIA